MSNGTYIEGFNNGCQQATDEIFKKLIADTDEIQGLTRSEILALAKDFGYEVETKSILRSKETAESVGDIDAYKKNFTKQKFDVYAVIYRRAHSTPNATDYVGQVWCLDGDTFRLVAEDNDDNYLKVMHYLDNLLEDKADVINKVYKKYDLTSEEKCKLYLDNRLQEAKDEAKIAKDTERVRKQLLYQPDGYSVIYATPSGGYVSELFYLQNNSLKLVAENAVRTYDEATKFATTQEEKNAYKFNKIHRRQFSTSKEYCEFITELVMEDKKKQEEQKSEEVGSGEYSCRKRCNDVINMIKSSGAVDEYVTELLSMFDSDKALRNIFWHSIANMMIDK